MIDTWSTTSRASLIKRLISGRIVLMLMSKPEANTEHFLCNCHDFYSILYYFYDQIDLCFVSQGRVRTAIGIGGQFCCKFTSASVCQKLSKYSMV